MNNKNQVIIVEAYTNSDWAECNIARVLLTQEDRDMIIEASNFVSINPNVLGVDVKVADIDYGMDEDSIFLPEGGCIDLTDDIDTASSFAYDVQPIKQKITSSAIRVFEDSIRLEGYSDNREFYASVFIPIGFLSIEEVGEDYVPELKDIKTTNVFEYYMSHLIDYYRTCSDTMYSMEMATELAVKSIKRDILKFDLDTGLRLKRLLEKFKSKHKLNDSV